MARLANRLSELDLEIINRLKEKARETKSRHFSIEIEDLIEQGYSMERIQESLSLVSALDLRELDPETLESVLGS